MASLYDFSTFQRLVKFFRDERVLEVWIFDRERERWMDKWMDIDREIDLAYAWKAPGLMRKWLSPPFGIFIQKNLDLVSTISTAPHILPSLFFTRQS